MPLGTLLVIIYLYDTVSDVSPHAVKGNSSEVGLTQNLATMRRSMVSGPDIAHVMGEFESSIEKTKTTELRHHEQTQHEKIAFSRDAKLLNDVREEMVNPSSNCSSDLFVLNTETLLTRRPLLIPSRGTSSPLWSIEYFLSQASVRSQPLSQVCVSGLR